METKECFRFTVEAGEVVHIGGVPYRHEGGGVFVGATHPCLARQMRDDGYPGEEFPEADARPVPAEWQGRASRLSDGMNCTAAQAAAVKAETVSLHALLEAGAVTGLTDVPIVATYLHARIKRLEDLLLVDPWVHGETERQAKAAIRRERK